MSKVFVALWHYMDESGVIGVFGTEEKAEAFINNADQDSVPGITFYRNSTVEEHGIDDWWDDKYADQSAYAERLEGELEREKAEAKENLGLFYRERDKKDQFVRDTAEALGLKYVSQATIMGGGHHWLDGQGNKYSPDMQGVAEYISKLPKE